MPRKPRTPTTFPWRQVAPCLLACLLAACPAWGATLSTNLVFEAPVLALDSSGRTAVAIAGEGTLAMAGRPVLPERLLYIGLPAGAVVTGFSATPALRGTEPLPAAPAYAQAAQPVGRPTASATAPDPSVFGVDADYPGSFGELVSVQERRGRPVAAIRLHPVQVNPVRLVATSAESIAVEIAYTIPRRAGAAATRAVPASGENDWAYLIVTSASLADSFAPLVAAKEAAGTAVKVVSVADVSANAAYAATDTQAAIRNCIRDGYENHGTRYVLLGGDNGIVPERAAYGHNENRTTSRLVTDLYYACLDGSWDGDGDGLYGEPNDGDNGGDVDLLAEVYVGRAPVHNAAEVTNFVAKTLAFAAHPRVGEAAFLGEYLGDGAQGGRALDPLRDLFLTHNVEWLDDRPSMARVWTSSQARALLNQSPALVAHVGHGSAYNCLGMNNTTAATLANASPFFLCSSACESGFFDYASRDCFAEVVMNSGHGVAGCLLNTREGWYFPMMEWLGSEEFIYGFYEQAILHGKPAGVALSLAREGLLAKVETSGDMLYRWCYFTATLFGDPQLAFPLPDPMAVVAEGGLSRTVPTGEADASASFAFSVRNLSETAFGWTASLCGGGPLALSAATGTAPALGLSSVTASIPSSALPLAEGTYTNTVVFTNTASGASASFVAEVTAIRPPVVSSPAMGPSATLAFGDVVAGLSSSAVVTISNASDTASIALAALLCDGEAVSNGIPVVEFIGFDSYDLALASFRSTAPGSPTLLAGRSTCLYALAMSPADTNTLYAIDDDLDALVAIDLAHGCAETVLAALPAAGNGEWTGLALHPWDGNLYATAVTDKGCLFFLIDLSTGEIVPLATLADAEIIALACDDHGAFYGIDLAENELLRLDPFTGDSSCVGPLGFDVDYSQGLDWYNGRLYWASFAARLVGELRVVDRSDASSRMAGILAGTAPDAPWGEYEIVARRQLSAFTASGADFPLVVPAGGSVDLSIAFEPATAGEFQSTFGLVCEGGGEPIATFRCTGRGLAPSAIPAGWLNLHGLAPDGSDDAEDADGDGFTNGEEWLAGTDPKDAASRLAFKGAGWTNACFQVEWSAIPGRRYDLLAASAPGGPCDVVTNVLGTGTSARAIDSSAPSATNRFYRLRVRGGAMGAAAHPAGGD